MTAHPIICFQLEGQITEQPHFNHNHKYRGNHPRRHCYHTRHLSAQSRIEAKLSDLWGSFQTTPDNVALSSRT